MPPEDSLDVSRRIKMYCYTCADIVKEFGKHDKEPAKYVKQWKGNNSKTGAPFSCEIGYERFLAPEIEASAFLFKSRFVCLHAFVIDK